MRLRRMVTCPRSCSQRVAELESEPDGVTPEPTHLTSVRCFGQERLQPLQQSYEVEAVRPETQRG